MRSIQKETSVYFGQIIQARRIADGKNVTSEGTVRDDAECSEGRTNIARVRGNETWVPFVNVENKER
jgi:hypothetical protein